MRINIVRLVFGIKNNVFYFPCNRAFGNRAASPFWALTPENRPMTYIIAMPALAIFIAA